jgi:hypothetical protein
MTKLFGTAMMKDVAAAWLVVAMVFGALFGLTSACDCAAGGGTVVRLQSALERRLAAAPDPIEDENREPPSFARQILFEETLAALAD